MYLCKLQFGLIGYKGSVFEIIRTMQPLEHFVHDFFEAQTPEKELIEKSDVIFAGLQGTEPEGFLSKLIACKRKDTQLILLMEKEQTSLVEDCMDKITDIWFLPMSEAEIRFRFVRWQQNCKMNRDLWQASQYLETTINSVPNLIWYKDKEGIHRKVNDSFCKMVNKTKEQVEGRDHYYIWDVDPDEAGNDCMESDLEVMNRQVVCVSEELVQNGKEKKLLTTYKAPLYDWDGSVMGTVGVGIDVTQERAYEREIINKNRSLETIFTTLDCGIICHLADGSRILSINQAALDLLDYESREELMESGFNMIAPSVMDEDKPKLREAIQTLQKEGDSASIEYRVQHKDGKILHIMGNIKLLSENGEMFYQRFLLDCTEQKLQEKENERRQTELIQALSTDYSLVCFFDLDTGMGMPLRVDEQNQNMFGDIFLGEISFSESMDHYIDMLVYEDDREMLRETCAQENLKRELEKRRMFYVNYRIHMDNQIKYYEMKVVRAGIRDESYGVVLGFRSVDEATRADMEQKMLLEDALLQANRANKAKSAFLSNMSHDIRTPMNAIVGFTALASARIDSKEQVQEYLSKISASGKHLLELINNVLDMSRIESGKMQLEETASSLSDIVYELSNIVQADVREKRLKLSVDTDGIVNQEIYCDRLRLKQVLLNVIGNSMKYTDAGGDISLRISERQGASSDYADYEFRIKDTGRGMSREFVSHIFDPFEREQNTTASEIQGTGLGMAITKNIVDMMHGTIEVESEKGVGTEVVIRFTFRLSHDMEHGAALNPQSDVLKTVDDNAGLERFSGVRILLAEDNELNQEIATAILSDAGFEIEVARNGQIAVEMVKKMEPGYYRLVLMDVQMPVMNGYEATRAIRELPDRRLASIPILAMTANVFEEDKQESIKSGMNGHIAKPINIAQLFEELGKVLD